MTQHEISSATNEELLRRLIAAQVRGGCDKFENGLDEAASFVRMDLFGWSQSDSWHVLEILLDSHGCKAAYGETRTKMGAVVYDDEAGDRIVYGNEEYDSHEYGGGTFFYPPRWKVAHAAIANSWTANGGNNLRVALETAVSFLPE